MYRNSSTHINQSEFIITLFWEYQLRIKSFFGIKRIDYIFCAQISQAHEPIHRLCHVNDFPRSLVSAPPSTHLCLSIGLVYCIDEYNVNHFVSPFNNNIVITYSIYA